MVKLKKKYRFSDIDIISLVSKGGFGIHWLAFQQICKNRLEEGFSVVTEESNYFVSFYNEFRIDSLPDHCMSSLPPPSPLAT